MDLSTFIQGFRFTWEETDHWLGFSIWWFIIPVLILIGIVIVLALSIHVYRRWKRPYACPHKLYFGLASNLKLTRREMAVIRALSANAGPMVQCQLLLDPSRWPAEMTNTRQKNLYKKLFES